MVLKLIREDYLPVSSLHKIYFAEYGDPHGLPILFIHGGPGSKSKTSYLDVIPKTIPFRAILFDQRGCGQSQPSGEIKENTTQHLIEDIEKLRSFLKIKKWFLIRGRSWGSTLALLYAQAHPTKVQNLLLSSIFLARKEDMEWLYSPKGAIKFFPDKAERIKNFLQKHNLSWSELNHYAYQIITKGALTQKKELAALIFGWEYGLMNLDVNFNQLTPDEMEEENINSLKIYLHYSTHQFFIKNNEILTQIKTIKNIPTFILHGRYDMVCPPNQAYLLHQHLKNSKLIFINYASHHLGWDGYQWEKQLLSQISQIS